MTINITVKRGPEHPHLSVFVTPTHTETGEPAGPAVTLAPGEEAELTIWHGHGIEITEVPLTA